MEIRKPMPPPPTRPEGCSVPEFRLKTKQGKRSHYSTMIRGQMIHVKTAVPGRGWAIYIQHDTTGTGLPIFGMTADRFDCPADAIITVYNAGENIINHRVFNEPSPYRRKL